MAKVICDGYHSVTPYLVVRAGGAETLEFYKRVFTAVERERLQDASDKVRNADITPAIPA